MGIGGDILDPSGPFILLKIYIVRMYCTYVRIYIVRILDPSGPFVLPKIVRMYGAYVRIYIVRILDPRGPFICSRGRVTARAATSNVIYVYRYM
jgi:hypothetical protein